MSSQKRGVLLDFAKARGAVADAENQSAAEALTYLSQLMAAGEIESFFVGWAMKDGSIHYGWVPEGIADEASLRALSMLGMMRLVEKGFTDAFTLSTELPPSNGA
jgi:hypothetical protein